MTPVEQTLIMFGILIGVLLIGVGIMKGSIWLWEKLKELAGPVAAGAAGALVLIVAVHGATSQQESLAQRHVEQLQAQGIEARVVTIDEADARRLVEEARRKGLLVETHDPTPGSAVPPDDVIVIRGDEDKIDELDPWAEQDEDNSFLSEEERQYAEDVRRGFVSELDW